MSTSTITADPFAEDKGELRTKMLDYLAGAPPGQRAHLEAAILDKYKRPAAELTGNELINTWSMVASATVFQRTGRRPHWPHGVNSEAEYSAWIARASAPTPRRLETCVVCGTKFHTTDPSAMCCSDSCETAATEEMYRYGDEDTI